MRLLGGVPEVPACGGSVTTVLLGALHTGGIVPAETGRGGGQAYGKRILKQAWLMFQRIHRKGEMEEDAWEERMREHQGLIVRRATGTVPEQKEARLIAKWMDKWEEEYFRFIDAGIEATNNPAELTIRQSVLDRAVTRDSGQ